MAPACRPARSKNSLARLRGRANRSQNGHRLRRHMRNPQGTLSYVKTRHPFTSPRFDASGTHSTRSRREGVMLTTARCSPARARGESCRMFQGGLGIYDVSNPEKPRHITNWRTTDKPGPNYARGVHRFDFDGRYAYISPTCDGYLGNIVMILDLKDPARPEEVGRWWMPGQWTAGGERPGGGRRAQVPPSLRYGKPASTSM